MNTDDRTKIWLDSCPIDVQEGIKRVIQKQIAEGILKHERMQVRQPHMLVDLRTNQIVQMPKSPAQDVLEFMVAMNQLPAPLSEYARTPLPTIDLATLLMFGDGEGAKKGEINEMADAWNAFTVSRSLEHLVEFVDGAIDSIYVILWTLNKLGVPADLCWKLVQDSNMAKLGPDGKPIKNPETGKIMKPEGWKPPDLFGLLSAAVANVTYVGGMASHD